MSETTMKKAQGNAFLGTEPIPKLLFRFAVPAIISMLVNAIYNVVDQIFIGWGIGDLGMAATNVSFPLVTISTAVGLLFGVGGASNFNLNLGKGRVDEASHIAGNSILYSAIAGCAIGIISLTFLTPLLYAFGTTEAIMPYAKPYTIITAIGIPFAVFSTTMGHLVRADGRPTFAMVGMLSGAIFNLVFDPIFLFVFHMGIEGIALATTLGQVLSSGIGIYYLLRKFRSVPLSKEHFRPSMALLKSIVALGVAACFNQLAMTVVQIVKNNTLRHYGGMSVYGAETTLAAVGAISKISIIFMAFIIGMAQGCQPIQSYNYGAKNYKRVRQAYYLAIFYSSGFAIFSFLCYQLFPRQIMGIFGTGGEEYYQFAIKYLRIFMLMAFTNGIQPTTSNFFTSIGKAHMGFWMSLTRQILLLTPMLLIFPLFWGIDGVMVAGPVSDGIAATVALIFGLREMKKLKQMEEEQLRNGDMDPPPPLPEAP
ncbi:MATE family efflux transporter [Eubacteriales bacterium OttesenSCG-928-M02]|nr:MATE family efflux transporter [Eubacteriales bacterium OttesenSCG-928-M02]